MILVEICIFCPNRLLLINQKSLLVFMQYKMDLVWRHQICRKNYVEKHCLEIYFDRTSRVNIFYRIKFIIRNKRINKIVTYSLINLLFDILVKLITHEITWLWTIQECRKFEFFLANRRLERYIKRWRRPGLTGSFWFKSILLSNV